MNPVDYFGVLVLILDSNWLALEYDSVMRSKQSFLSFSSSNRVSVLSLIDIHYGCCGWYGKWMKRLFLSVGIDLTFPGLGFGKLEFCTILAALTNIGAKSHFVCARTVKRSKNSSIAVKVCYMSVLLIVLVQCPIY